MTTLTAEVIDEAPDFDNKMSLEDRLSLASTILPTFAAVAVIAAYPLIGISLLDVGLFLGMFLVSVLGITVGYHRYFTHHSFKTSRVMEWVLIIAGSIGGGGPVIWWVAFHRKHHQFAEQDRDPHSPRDRGIVRGFAHSHFTWFFAPEYHGMKSLYYMAKYARDLSRQPHVLMLSKYHNVILVAGLFVPAILGGLIGGSLSAALSGFLWAGIVRLAVFQHSQWSVNSVGHMWGGRSYETKDDSRNNLFVAIMTAGEGWHNNHHAFPYSARHGLKLAQVDLSYIVIRALEKCRLVSDVLVPDKEALASRTR